MILGALVVGRLLALAASAPQTQNASSSATLFEGARLIAGDLQPPIERSAFLVENGRFTRVGRLGDVQGPAGVKRVDLTELTRYHCGQGTGSF
jgi:hypothetical protein